MPLAIKSQPEVSAIGMNRLMCGSNAPLPAPVPAPYVLLNPEPGFYFGLRFSMRATSALTARSIFL